MGQGHIAWRGSPNEAADICEHYGLSDISNISDITVPDQLLKLASESHSLNELISQAKAAPITCPANDQQQVRTLE